MTVQISKPAFNLREALTSLKRKIGLKGAEIMKAETVSDVYTSINPVMFRNRIINGDFRVAQRGTSFSGGGYHLDRWVVDANNSGSFTYAQVTDAPPGFTHSLKITTSSAFSATSYQFYQQPIEGLNIADFALGTGSAKTFTISFWVKASIAGAYSLSVTNSGNVYSYPTSYTVNAANVWEYKTITVPGATAGSWATDTGVGMRLKFDIGSGSFFDSAANTWTANDRHTVAGTVKLGSVSGATLQLTGVQIEPGSVATPFEYRPYATELALCQRYFVKIGGESSVSAAGSGVTTATNSGWGVVTYPVTMRVAPTTTLNGTGITLSNGSVYPTSPSLGAVYANRHAAMISLTYSGTPYSGAGQGTTLYFQNAANDSMSFSSEL